MAVCRPGFIRLQTSAASEASPTFYFYFIVPNFLILSSTILLLNVKIAVTAWKQSKRIQTDNVVQQQNQVMMSNQMKITKMLTTVVGLFYVTYIPSVVLGFFSNLDRDIQYMVNLTVLICLMNHWINPIVYFLKNKELRKSYVQVLSIKNEQ